MSNTKLQAEAKDTLTAATDVVEENAKNLKLKLADNLSSAASTFHDKSDVAKSAADSGIDRANDVVESGLNKANQLAHTAVAKANDLGHKTASVIENTSEYVKDFDFAEVRNDLREKVVARPEISLVTAGFFGLAIGLLIGNRFRNR